MGRQQQRERRTDWLIGLGVAASIAAVVVLVVTSGWLSDSADCGEYEFDAAAWSGPPGTRSEEAQELAVCDRLVGLDRSQVADLLGRRGQGRTWVFDAGQANNDLGPGDAQSLFVDFDADGRVEAVEVSYP